ncbi:hypothetical protein F5B18DRAFT_204462 [Nemania serpens]|nr:hypothetical protein F5B18DRAFT_204462 [Nemania serpens]
MSFSTNAFDLTPEDQHVMLGKIKSLLLLTSAAIAQAKLNCSWDDYTEAHRYLEEALVYATDPNACHPTLAPLATCYLYKGHIHLGLGQYVAAFEAYEKAAASETHALTDIPAARDAARQMLEIRDLAEAETKAKGTPPPSLRGGSGSVWGLVSGAKKWRGETKKVSLMEALAAGAYGARLPAKIHAGPGRVGEVRRMDAEILRPEVDVEIIKMRPRGPGLEPARPGDLKTRRVL